MSWNIQDENEILFRSWIQGQDPFDDVDLAGVHTYYDIARERQRCMFAMVALRGRRERWVVKVILVKKAGCCLMASELLDLAILLPFRVSFNLQDSILLLLSGPYLSDPP